MSKVMTFIKLLKTPSKMIWPLGSNEFLKWMPDRMYLKILYRAETGRSLQLNPPHNYNEKLQWIKLYDRRPEYTTMVDKLAVKDYVRRIIGNEYIIPTIMEWGSVDEIDFKSLPNQFVIKCNHDSGGLVICSDRNKLEVTKAQHLLKKRMKRNAYWPGREWPYKNVTPRLFAEKYLTDGSDELRDYKVMCFNGIPKIIQVHTGRFSNHRQNLYDEKWNTIPLIQDDLQPGRYEDKPVFLEEMLELSEKLAQNIPEVRVDWYYVDNQLYFGELTFFDASGFGKFNPDSYNDLWGSWITLPCDK